MVSTIKGEHWARQRDEALTAERRRNRQRAATMSEERAREREPSPPKSRPRQSLPLVWACDAPASDGTGRCTFTLAVRHLTRGEARRRIGQHGHADPQQVDRIVAQLYG